MAKSRGIKRETVEEIKMTDNFWFDNTEISFETNEEKVFLNYLIRFQNGDFSAKREFVDFFLNTSDWNIYVQGVRLFMAICSHSDMEMLTAFLNECDEEQLRVFLAYIPEALTVQVIPILLALYEDWEDTYLGQDIARCICGLLGKEYHEEIHYDVNELGDLFISFSKENDLSMYYYKGKIYFAGEITKKIISMATYCRSKSKKFLGDQMPSILSNGTGIECPVHYNTEINDDTITRLYGYVNTIIEKRQLRGKKYFYNHIINS